MLFNVVFGLRQVADAEFAALAAANARQGNKFKLATGGWDGSYRNLRQCY
jgi:hypothetical protein